MSVTELHNIVVVTTADGGLKEEKMEEIIIMLPQTKNMSDHHRVVCGCKYYISDKSIHSYLLSWIYFYLKKIKDQSKHSHSRWSVEIEIHIYETYKNTAIAHGLHIHKTASDLDMAKICDFPLEQHALPHWKCVYFFAPNVQVLSILTINVIVSSKTNNL